MDTSDKRPDNYDDLYWRDARENPPTSIWRSLSGARSLTGLVMNRYERSIEPEATSSEIFTGTYKGWITDDTGEVKAWIPRPDLPKVTNNK